MAINLASRRATSVQSAFDLSQRGGRQGGGRRRPAPLTSAQEAVEGAPRWWSACCPPASMSKACFWATAARRACWQGIAKGALIIDSSTIAAATSQKVAKAAAGCWGLVLSMPPSPAAPVAQLPARLTFMVGGSNCRSGARPPAARKNGQANIFHAGRCGRGPDRQDLQQHAAGHPDGRHLRGHRPGRSQRPGPEGAERNHAPQLRRQLGAGKVQPLPRRARKRTRQQGLHRRLRHRPDAQRPGLSQENATAVKASTPLGGLARAIYAAHSIAGHGGEDFSSVIKMLQKKG